MMVIYITALLEKCKGNQCVEVILKNYMSSDLQWVLVKAFNLSLLT